jgi:HK97 gp10 family phage protein
VVAITVELVGVPGAKRRIGRVGKIVPKVEAATARAGTMMQSDARDNAPVDTGNLVKSIIFTMIGSMLAIVEVAVGYGGFVEFGTTKMRAQPFFTPAFESTSTWYAKELERIHGAG